MLRTLGGDELRRRRESKYYEPIFEEHNGFDIMGDILKLENQIPLFVLHKLLQLELRSTAHVVDRKLLEVLVKGTFDIYPFDYDYIRDCSWTYKEDQHLTETYEEAQHLLGFLHTLIVSPPPRLPVESIIDVCIPRFSKRQGIPRAVELRNAGIKFKPSDGGIRGIKFDKKNATICLPRIIITEFTEILFRNLIALEMCKAACKAGSRKINYVAHYTDLMDQLIDSEQDVAVLRKVSIVTNDIGSDEEVAKIFNGLCKGVTVGVEDVFDKLTQQVNAVNARKRNRFNVQIADLVEKHFSSPWKIIALAVATVILLLSVVQTIFSVI